MGGITWTVIWKLVPSFLVGIFLLTAVGYIDHQGYKRAKDQAALQAARDEQTRLELRNLINSRITELERRMQDSATINDQKLHQAIDDIDIQQRTIIQPTITREIHSDPRYVDPKFGISIVLRNALNQARAESGCTDPSAVVSGTGCSVPASGSTHRTDN